LKEIFALKPGFTEKEVELATAAMGLQLTMKGTLKTLPANIHWHYKKPEHKGTLEITLLLSSHQLIVECKPSRWGDWVEEVLGEFVRRLAA
jgi:hypothetical protein